MKVLLRAPAGDRRSCRPLRFPAAPGRLPRGQWLLPRKCGVFGFACRSLIPKDQQERSYIG